MSPLRLSSVRFSAFRLCLSLIVVAFAATSFLYAYRLQDCFREQEGYLWQARRENFLLRSTMGEVSEERDWLVRRGGVLEQDLAVAQQDLALTQQELRAATTRALAADLSCAALSAEVDRLGSQAAFLEQDHARMAMEHRRMAARVFEMYVANKRDRWIDGIREAGSWMTGVLKPEAQEAPDVMGWDPALVWSPAMSSPAMTSSPITEGPTTACSPASGAVMTSGPAQRAERSSAAIVDCGLPTAGASGLSSAMRPFLCVLRPLSSAIAHGTSTSYASEAIAVLFSDRGAAWMHQAWSWVRRTATATCTDTLRLR